MRIYLLRARSDHFSAFSTEGMFTCKRAAWARFRELRQQMPFMHLDLACGLANVPMSLEYVVESEGWLDE